MSLKLGSPGKLPGGEVDGPPPGGAPFARIWGCRKEGHRPPGVSWDWAVGWDGEADHSCRGRGCDPGRRGRGSPAAGYSAWGGGWWSPAARLAAALLPGGRCILRVSTRGCGRKEGIRPLHTSPLVRHAPSLAPARSLPRSLAHTHARTRRRGFPSRARSPSGSSGRLLGSGLVRPPVPRLPPLAAP